MIELKKIEFAKSSLRKARNFNILVRSASFRICDLRNLIADRPTLRDSNRFRFRSSLTVLFFVARYRISAATEAGRNMLSFRICDLRSAAPLRNSSRFRSILTVLFFCRQIPNQRGDRGGTGSGIAGCSVPHHLGPPAPHQDGSQVSIG